MPEEHKYFQDALSDFMYDMASGGAIRQMANRGYSVDQIMKSLDFPTPRERVEKTVYKHLLASGILLDQLPRAPESFLVRFVPAASGAPRRDSGKQLSELLHAYIRANGEENSYMLCPFGEWKKNHKEELAKWLAPLNQREREYIMGIPFARNVMFHRLSGRMYEIGLKLVREGRLEGRFFFLTDNIELRTNHPIEM